MTQMPAPLEPTASSGLLETQKYLEYLEAENRPIEVRTLIGFWGYKGRGKNTVAAILGDLAKMSLRTVPPFDSGPLDSSVVIQKLSGDVLTTAAAEQPDDHLLTLSRIPSAAFALRAEQRLGSSAGYVYRDTPIADAVTTMLRNDFSQLPVIESETRREVYGVFTWESYAQARLRGDDPKTVASSVFSTSPVDLHSDLFASVGPIADQGYVVVTYRGSLSGIVTASDLTREFEDLAMPFLAIGRCEQELRRVARGKLADQVAKTKKPFENYSFGDLQDFFKSNWSNLGWSLSLTEFNGWLNATRQLRNTIAHFDNQDEDSTAELEAVHRLTKWLRSIATPTDSVGVVSANGDQPNVQQGEPAGAKTGTP